MPSPETYHSSLRRCDLYDNPYNTQMQAHPSIVKQRQSDYASKDSISSAQTKLERELFESFKQQGMQLFSGKYFIIGQAGKFAFLAIMLPTYLFFYGIPKWMLTEAAPNIYNFTKRIVTNAGSKLGSAVSHVASAAFAIVRTVTDPILNFIQTRIEKGREFYHNTKQKIEMWIKATAYKALYPFRLANEKVLTPFKQVIEKVLNPVKTIREMVSNMLEKIKEANNRFRQALLDFPNKLAETFQAIPDKMKTFLSRVSQFLNPVIEVYKRADSKISEWFEKAQSFNSRMLDKFVYRPASAFYDLYDRAKEWSKEKLQQLTDPVVNWAQPKIDKINAFARQIKERIDKVTEAVSSKVREVTDKISEIIKDPSVIKQDLAQILPQPVIAFFAPILSFTGNVAFAPFRLSKRRKEAGKFVTRIKEKLKTRLVRMNKKLFSFLKNSYAKAKPKCIAFAKRTAKLIHKTFIVIKEMFKGAFYMLRMIFAWLKILIKHGMFIVRETCASWLPSFNE